MFSIAANTIDKCRTPFDIEYPEAFMTWGAFWTSYDTASEQNRMLHTANRHSGRMVDLLRGQQEKLANVAQHVIRHFTNR